jgi:hypothetical protein
MNRPMQRNRLQNRERNNNTPECDRFYEVRRERGNFLMSAYLNGSVAPSKHDDFASSQRVHRAGAEDDGKKEGRMEMLPWQVGIRSTGLFKPGPCNRRGFPRHHIQLGIMQCRLAIRCTKRGPPPMGMQRCIARTCRTHRRKTSAVAPAPYANHIVHCSSHTSLIHRHIHTHPPIVPRRLGCP